MVTVSVGGLYVRTVSLILFTHTNSVLFIIIFFVVSVPWPKPIHRFRPLSGEKVECAIYGLCEKAVSASAEFRPTKTLSVQIGSGEGCCGGGVGGGGVGVGWNHEKYINSKLKSIYNTTNCRQD